MASEPDEASLTTPPHPHHSHLPTVDKLKTDARLQETIEDRRKQTITKGKLAMARLRLLGRLKDGVSMPPNSAGNDGPPASGAPVDQDLVNQEPKDWDAELGNESAEEEPAEFTAIEKWFKSLQKPSIGDMIKYQTAKFEEDTRQRRLLSRKSLGEQEELVDNQLFCSEDEEAAPSHKRPHDGDSNLSENHDVPASTQSANSDPPVNKRRKSNKITASERKGSLQLGLDIALSMSKNAANQSARRTTNSEKRLPAAKGTRSRRRNIGDSVHGRSKPGKRKYSKANDLDLGTLFGSDIIGAAHANSSMPVPTFTDKNKDKALAELIASIPAADRKDAIPDKQAVKTASRKFTRPAKSDGKGGWKLKGMKTSLYSYQLLGAAFMRDRENSPTKPDGGFLCDVMGFGKTIQALANMVDGISSDQNDPEKTTLIVVPAHLVSHWANQIGRHCEPGALGPILHHHSKSRMISHDPVNDFQMYGVIITTYDEIRRSYPDFKPPDSLTTETQIQEWWENTYKNHSGPLHRIKFRRIILDEGHYIKNPESKVSIAVRALIGRYKWILSGTPVHNRNEEFFPYFDFLKVPQVGRYEAFIHNYCNGDEISNKRLVNIVRPIMFRRTHAARLFAMPVLKLPDIGQRTVQVKFCEAELKIYNLMIKMFIERINGLSAPEAAECQCRCVLTMILKLRMFTSHVLTVQDIVKTLLSEKAMEELNHLLEDERQPGDPSVAIVHVLNALTSGATLAEPFIVAEPSQVSDNQSSEIRDKLITQFRKIMTDLHDSEAWEERLARTTCPSCGSVPIDPCITSCMHLYCEECLLLLSQGAEDYGDGNKICSSCGENIKETARCGSIEGLHVDPSPPPSQANRGNRGNDKRQKKQTPKRKGITGNTTHDDDGEEVVDWIPLVAHVMPSAKLSVMQDIIAQWTSTDPETKIVVFTQFYSVVRLIRAICEKNGWGHTSLTGNMPISAREKSMEDFRESADLRVLIASLKAGGIGLDLTMANKCILIDPWWNEAVQQQAYCRLFRIGQEKAVEVVKLVVRETIDEYMIDLQNRKSAEIDKTIGEAALSSRATVAELLKMFGRVEEGEGGGFTVIMEPEGQ